MKAQTVCLFSSENELRFFKKTFYHFFFLTVLFTLHTNIEIDSKENMYHTVFLFFQNK